MSRKLKGFALLLAASALAAPTAWAGNGNTLHGIGAVNSSMGGAGVALPNDALGALNLNPALLTQLDGHKMEFSAELADDDITVSSQVGPFSGSTEHTADPSLIPAFGFTAHKPGAKIAFGVGFLGLAGFGADFPQDSTNPLFAPQPIGFGHVFSSYALMKVPTVVAFQVNDSLSVGGAFVAGRASLTARPAGFASPDCTPTGVCFVPSVDSDSAWGFGAQIGVLYKVNPAFNIGLSYQSEMEFEDFEWNSAVANPGLPTFGTNREITLQVNNPANVVIGIGFTPNDRLKIALDAKQLFYKDTEGFGNVLGWDDITAFALGIQFQATPKLALRAGYNQTEGAIPDEATFFNVASPAVFGKHATVGLGVGVTETLTMNLGYYRAFSEEISGPFISPVIGPVPGTSVTTEMKLDGILATFSFSL
ncbi:MAG TPA: outer membrane protein transport protein [Thermoanaerobaculia bacterium]|nr:outer membrane protein transport protein [Thermoanaerobaculia bacterium]